MTRLGLPPSTPVDTLLAPGSWLLAPGLIKYGPSTWITSLYSALAGSSVGTRNTPNPRAERWLSSYFSCRATARRAQQTTVILDGSWVGFARLRRAARRGRGRSGTRRAPMRRQPAQRAQRHGGDASTVDLAMSGAGDHERYRSRCYGRRMLYSTRVAAWVHVESQRCRPQRADDLRSWAASWARCSTQSARARRSRLSATSGPLAGPRR